MSDTFALYRKVTALPLGKQIFSFIYAQKATYFWTVRPQVREVRPHHAALTIKKRRAVQNHIGTVHAIAVCNGLEAAMGLLAEATVPKDRRWIPKGMEVAYLAKSTTDLLCTADTDPADWEQTGDVPVRVKAIREDGTVVVEGTITIYVSDKKK
ncbi:thioesterase [Knoellia sinensis KCTC 19936]|uniref:Thioesterase n=1 Tax=Knoellia sinensis KCTC 19936 TaxID=1385520 RepID=A0A0A0JBV4_9MICO|nr:hotdog fold domain-containing protein [Knoellia sinensis]KGN34648.1 thioesterase [Knoellia sinensis KCTC 19936]